MLGNILMLSGGRHGIDNVYSLKEGMIYAHFSAWQSLTFSQGY
jgi:hypothetical protein